MTALPKMRSATKAEFDAFIAAYPYILARSVSQIYDPPLVTYHDFSIGKGHASIVAYHCAPRDPDPASDWHVKEQP